jgi:hypothetical protein
VVLDKSAQAGTHTHAERGDDLYETPACAVQALLEVEPLPTKIWEPACGPGAIVRVLLENGHEVVASDITDFGWGHVVRDFLDLPDPQVPFPIVTNPPYQLAEKFVRKALAMSPLVIMLLRLAFLESQRRTDILENSGLARVHVFRKRLPMMHRAGWAGPKASSAMPFAWFVWERGYAGPTTIDRI